jgi:hypothetical protein
VRENRTPGSRRRREETAPVGNTARRWRLPPTLHRTRQPTHPARRLHGQPDRRLGHPAVRQFSWTLQEHASQFRFLIHDRDSKFTRSFDAGFASEGIEIVKSPVQAPKANAIAERLVGTARRECLDWLSILNRRHLERVLRVFVDQLQRT